jgi:predicted RNA-binding protein with PIN domain
VMERTTVASFGAVSMSAWQLREEIEAAGRDLDARLKQMRRHYARAADLTRPEPHSSSA